MNILAFGIHPDDVELGCGGTLALCAKRGDTVAVVDLTRGERSSNGTPEIRAAEAEEGARVLGLSSRDNLGLPDAGVAAENPDQVAAAVAAIRAARPHVILTPNGDDPHPDHASGAGLVERAVYLAGIHGYMPERDAWRTPSLLVYSGRNEVRIDVVVDITAVYETKTAAIRAHRSQFEPSAGSKATPLNAADFLAAVEARDRTHGHRIGVRFGEGYQLARPLLLSDLRAFSRPTGDA